MLRRLRIVKPLLKPIIKAQVSEQPTLIEGAELLYLLPRPSLTDLAVLSTAAQRLGMAIPEQGMKSRTGMSVRYEFLTQNVGRVLRRSLMRTCPPRLRLAHELVRSGQAIQVVPVSIFWSRAPQHESSLLRILFSERWTATSRLRRLIDLLINRQMVQVVFGPAIDLAQLVNSGLGEARELRRSARLLRVIFKNQRRALLGPELSLKRRAMSLVLSHPEVQLAIERDASTHGRPTKQSTRLAQRILAGIVSDFSAITLRIAYRFLAWCFRIGGAEFSIRGMEPIRQCAQQANLVYLPCHQSHLDYIVLSFLLYREGLAIPHIASGENLDLPVLGSILRQCGAFFIRRSFRDDDLYRNLITQYLRQILLRGHSVEFFLEGTRSRTGFLMPARLGMMQVTLSAAQKPPARPLALVPVRFGFERLIDGDSFARELAGASKRKETWGGLVRGFKQMRAGLGSIGLAFGEPIVLRDTSELHAGTIANLVLRKVNANLLVTGTHLIALTLLSAAQHRMERGLLEGQMALYIEWLCAEGFTCLENDVDGCIQAAARQGLLRFETITDVDLISTSEKGENHLPWHRNNALHSLALPSLMALASARSALQETPSLQITLLWPLLANELHLGELTAGLYTRWRNRMDSHDMLDTEGLAQAAASSSGRSLRLLARLLAPTLERHLLILDTAIRHPINEPVARETIQAESLRRAAQLAEVSTESLNRDCARLALGALLSTSVLVEHPGIHPGPGAEQLADEIAPLVSSEFLEALSNCP